MPLPAKFDKALFGVRANGHDVGISFPSAGAASDAAGSLVAHGYKSVDIFERATGRVVTHVSPSPAAA